MTRVSDRAAFAAAVADGGGAAVPGAGADARRRRWPRCSSETTRAARRPAVGRRHPRLRAAGAARRSSSRSIRAPPAAVRADRRRPAGPGARRSRTTASRPTCTCPSPGLLRLFLERRRAPVRVRGPRVRRPRRAALELRALGHDGRGAARRASPAGDAGRACHVLFAGGIHDARSAAMVAALAAPLAERGVEVGVLIGTAYLFTEEAVATGAITRRLPGGGPRRATGTVLLETGPGHATRCVAVAVRRRSSRARSAGCARTGVPARGDARRARGAEPRPAAHRLEGHRPRPRLRPDPEAPKLVDVDDDEQWQRGHVHDRPGRRAARRASCTLAELHRDVVGRQRRAASQRSRLPARAPTRSAGAAARPTSRSSAWPAPARGARPARRFWANILNKVDAITEVPPDRWDWRHVLRRRPQRRATRSTRAGAASSTTSRSTRSRSGMPPNALRSIEPFQLLSSSRRARRSPTPATPTGRSARERTSVILGAGGGGADLGVGYAVRSCAADAVRRRARPS